MQVAAPASRRALAALLLLVAGAAALGDARAEERPYGESGPGAELPVGPLTFDFHGYFRAPMSLSWRDRCPDTGACDPRYNLHTPWLIDDDYFRSGFAYTRLNEHDYAELYLGVGTPHVSAHVALMGSLFSDWARPLLENQLGIAQGFLQLDWKLSGARTTLRIRMKGGSFWDRFGWMESYDTYLFGRTHQMGAQGRLELSAGALEAVLLYGFGAHLEDIQANQGLTLLNYAHAGVAYAKRYQLGLYVLDAQTQDQRQLQELKDADLKVLGADATVDTPLTGRLWLGLSHVGATQSKYLSPAIEVLHSYGGQGLTSNFLLTEKSDKGNGALWSFGFEGAYGLRRALERLSPTAGAFLRGGDVTLRYFGLVTYLEDAPAEGRDRSRTYFKWGLDLAWSALPWLTADVRYDRVILDTSDEANSFRVITPRLVFHTRYWLDAQLRFQYSHYSYDTLCPTGRMCPPTPEATRALLRPGQVQLETQPDSDVFKIQAQFVF